MGIKNKVTSDHSLPENVRSFAEQVPYRTGDHIVKGSDGQLYQVQTPDPGVADMIFGADYVNVKLIDKK